MKLYESDYRLLDQINRTEKYSLAPVGRDTLQRMWALRDAGLIMIAESLLPNSSTRTFAYAVITDAGRDALAEKQRSENEMVQEIAKQHADDERRAAERAEDKRRDFAYFILGLLFGWLLGLVTPRDIINAIHAAVQWAQSLFH